MAEVSHWGKDVGDMAHFLPHYHCFLFSICYTLPLSQTELLHPAFSTVMVPETL